MNLKRKKNLQCRRRMRIRKGVLGTLSRPRLSLHFSGKHIYAQCIDDDTGRTLVYLSTVAKKPNGTYGTNISKTTSFGELFGKAALDAGIVAVVFDRDKKRYHGKVKAFADSVRNMGLKF